MSGNKDSAEKAEEEEEKVTIKVTWNTREMLKELGSKGETYDMVIRKLLPARKEGKRQ